MVEFTKQEFIWKYLIDEIEDIVERHPFHAFVLMAVGVEHLGILLSRREDVFEANHSKKDFNRAINELNSLAPYRQYLDATSVDLYTGLRCGLNHAFMPKTNILLTSKLDLRHLVHDIEGRLILRCEDFYSHYKSACEEVIQKLDAGLLAPNHKQKYSEGISSGCMHDLTSGTTMV